VGTRGCVLGGEEVRISLPILRTQDDGIS
jgi:hypothetical protein